MNKYVKFNDSDQKLIDTIIEYQEKKQFGFIFGNGSQLKCICT